MHAQTVALPLKRFLLIDQRPAEWEYLDLRLFQDEAGVFYGGPVG